MEDVTFMVFNLEEEEERLNIINIYENNSNKFIVWDEDDSKDLENSDWTYFGLWEDDELVAVTSVEDVTDTLCTMWGTIVKEEWRGNGYGNRLNQYVENHLREEGCTKISSHIYVENLPSLILKLKRGYLIEGTLMNHDSPGQHEYILGKIL